jgi:hypothetical protein
VQDTSPSRNNRRRIVALLVAAFCAYPSHAFRRLYAKREKPYPSLPHSTIDIKTYKLLTNRTIPNGLSMSALGTRVRVYWNLHKKTFSIQDTQSGLVIGHSQHVVIEDASFVVRQGGRLKVIETRRKNVHAFVVGKLVSVTAQPQRKAHRLTELTYNPYKYDSFVTKANDQAKVSNSEYVLLNNRQIFARM